MILKLHVWSEIFELILAGLHLSASSSTVIDLCGLAQRRSLVVRSCHQLAKMAAVVSVDFLVEQNTMIGLFWLCLRITSVILQLLAAIDSTCEVPLAESSLAVKILVKLIVVPTRRKPDHVLL